MSEQELFGLMAIAQEQQQAVATALAKLEQQQARLNATIEQARSAVADMSHAGDTAATVIGRAAREAVSAAMAGVATETGQTIGKAAAPTLASFKRAGEAAQEAYGELHAAAGWISWKWAGICAATSCGALAAFLGAAWLLVPSAGELAELRVERDQLRATVAELEALGGRLRFGTCGPEKRKCVRVDEKAGAFGSESERFMVLKGY